VVNKKLPTVDKNHKGTGRGGKVVEKFLLMPDQVDGHLPEYKNRILWYSGEDKINLRLPTLVLDFRSRLIATLGVAKARLHEVAEARDPAKDGRRAEGSNRRHGKVTPVAPIALGSAENGFEPGRVRDLRPDAERQEHYLGLFREPFVAGDQVLHPGGADEVFRVHPQV
jgi:hypothetical protein